MLCLMFVNEGNEVVVSNFCEIWNAWNRMPFYISRAEIVNHVLNAHLKHARDTDFT